MTNLPRKIYVLNVLAAAWLALAVIFAGIFVIVEHDHKHIDARGHVVPTSEDCQICIKIQIALRLMEAACRFGIYLAITAAIVRNFSSEKLQRVFTPFHTAALKVRYNC